MGHLVNYKLSVRQEFRLVHVKFHLCGSAERGGGRNTWKIHSLHFEIISSQFCVVNIQDCLGIESRGSTNLRTEKKGKQVRKHTVERMFHTACHPVLFYTADLQMWHF